MGPSGASPKVSGSCGFSVSPPRSALYSTATRQASKIRDVLIPKQRTFDAEIAKAKRALRNDIPQNLSYGLQIQNRWKSGQTNRNGWMVFLKLENDFLSNVFELLWPLLGSVVTPIVTSHFQNQPVLIIRRTIGACIWSARFFLAFASKKPKHHLSGIRQTLNTSAKATTSCLSLINLHR